MMDNGRMDTRRCCEFMGCYDSYRRFFRQEWDDAISDRAYKPIHSDANEEVTWHYEIGSVDSRHLPEQQHSHAAEALKHLEKKDQESPIVIVDVSFLATLWLESLADSLLEAIGSLRCLREVHVYSPFQVISRRAQPRLDVAQWRGILSMLRCAAPKLTVLTLDIDLLLSDSFLDLLRESMPGNRFSQLRQIVFGEALVACNWAFDALLNWLCQFPNLECVGLPSVSVEWDEMIETPDALVNFVRNGPTLHELAVPVRHSFVMMRGMMEALHRNMTLKKLTVHGLILEDDGLIINAKAETPINLLLKSNQCLEELTILLFEDRLRDTARRSYNCILDCVPKAGALRENDTLKRLSFRSNMPGIADYYAPAEAFNKVLKKHNNTLQYLDYDGHSLSDDTEFYLKLNRHKLRCLIDPHGYSSLSDKQAWAALVEHKDYPSISFCLLSRHPTLVTGIADCGLSVRPQKKAKT